MKKRILIKENKGLFTEIAKDLKQFIPLLNELKSSYEALEIGPFTNDYYKELILLGPEKYVQKYIKSLNDQLDKMGVKNSIMRKNAIKDHESVIEKFRSSVLNAKRFNPETYSATRPKLTLKFISYEDGFCISKVDKEMILETYCRIYLDNEEEIKIMDSIKALQLGFNQYLEILKNSGINGYNKFLLLGHVFKINNEGEAEIDFEGVKYITSYKKRYQEHLSTLNLKRELKLK